jgi:hypothetical protein
VTASHKWVIHGERLMDDTPHIRVSLADVQLPNHVRFTQYVFLPRHGGGAGSDVTRHRLRMKSSSVMTSMSCPLGCKEKA